MSDEESSSESGSENESVDTSEEEVFDLNVSSSGGSEEESDDDEEDLIERLPDHLRRVAKRAAKGEKDSTDDEESDDSESHLADWGKSKKLYYDADTADLEIGQDFEEAEEEEAAAMELQKAAYNRLKPSDFDSEASEGSDSDSSNIKQKQLKSTTEDDVDDIRPLILGNSATNLEEVESVERKFEGLGIKEKLSLLIGQSPELPGLLKELCNCVNEFTRSVDPLSRAISPDLGGSRDGMMYLQIKRQLMLGLITNTCFYMLLKAKGYSNTKNHPVIQRILEFRELMDTLTSIDMKLKPQIDLLVAALEQGIDLAEESKDYESEVDKSQLIDNTENTDYISESDSGEIVPEIDENELDAEERRFMNGIDKEKDHVKRKKKATTATHHLSDFGDQEEQKRGTYGGADPVSSLVNRIQQGEKLKNSKKMNSIVGDMDVRGLGRKDIEDSKPFRRPVPDDPDVEDDIDDLMGGIPKEALEFFSKMEEKRTGKRTRKDKIYRNGDTSNEKDTFMDAAMQRKEEKKKLKMMKYSVEPRIAGSLEAELEQERLRKAMGTGQGPRRGASYEIIKNRGLTPHRNKLSRNPRVKKREAYRKAIIRRKGQVREVRTNEAGRYAGETTGIRTTVVRGRKLGN